MYKQVIDQAMLDALPGHLYTTDLIRLCVIFDKACEEGDDAAIAKTARMIKSTTQELLSTCHRILKNQKV